jgi:hypothetical protein
MLTSFFCSLSQEKTGLRVLSQGWVFIQKLNLSKMNLNLKNLWFVYISRKISVHRHQQKQIFVVLPIEFNSNLFYGKLQLKIEKWLISQNRNINLYLKRKKNSKKLLKAHVGLGAGGKAQILLFWIWADLTKTGFQQTNFFSNDT